MTMALLLLGPILPPGPPSWRERDVVLMGIAGAVLLVVGIALVITVRRLRRRDDETLDEP